MLGEAVRLTAPSRARRALAVLRGRRPGWSEARSRSIVRASFRELGRTAADVVALERLDDVALCRHLEILGLDPSPIEAGAWCASRAGLWELVDRAAILYLDPEGRSSSSASPAMGYGIPGGFRIELRAPVEPDEEKASEGWIDEYPQRVPWMDISAAPSTDATA